MLTGDVTFSRRQLGTIITLLCLHPMPVEKPVTIGYSRNHYTRKSAHPTHDLGDYWHIGNSIGKDPHAPTPCKRHTYLIFTLLSIDLNYVLG